MYRTLCFIATLILPIIFGWWLFVPLAIIYIYLARVAYEIIIIGIILDSLYYFNGVFSHSFLIFSIILIMIALFLEGRIDWKKQV